MDGREHRADQNTATTVTPTGPSGWVSQPIARTAREIGGTYVGHRVTRRP
jgi:hypothetical protein